MLKRLLLVRGAELATFALLAAVPLAVQNPYALGLLTLLAIYGILLIGLDVTVGYLGQVNLAQVAFLGLGAYTAGLAVARLGWGMPAAALASTAVGVVLGGLLALPALRLEGPQFALATLSFSALTTTALNELESLTGGAQGLSLVRPRFLGHALTPPEFYWLCMALLALVWLTLRNLLSSQWGRAFEALRDSPIATDAMGVGTYRHKVAAFALGSGLGGLAGALYAFNFQYLQPQAFTGRPQEPLGSLRRRHPDRAPAQPALQPDAVPGLLGHRVPRGRGGRRARIAWADHPAVPGPGAGGGDGPAGRGWPGRAQHRGLAEGDLRHHAVLRRGGAPGGPDGVRRSLPGAPVPDRPAALPGTRALG